MTRVSHDNDTSDRIFCSLFVLVYVAFASASLVNGTLSLKRHWVELVALGVAGLLLFYSLKWMRKDLVSEVYDVGDFLFLRHGGETEIVPLRNIVDVAVSKKNRRYPEITLSLVSGGRFGSAISFACRHRSAWNPFAKNPFLEDLSARVYKAKLEPLQPPSSIEPPPYPLMTRFAKNLRPAVVVLSAGFLALAATTGLIGNVAGMPMSNIDKAFAVRIGRWLLPLYSGIPAIFIIGLPIGIVAALFLRRRSPHLMWLATLVILAPWVVMNPFDPTFYLVPLSAGAGIWIGAYIVSRATARRKSPHAWKP